MRLWVLKEKKEISPSVMLNFFVFSLAIWKAALASPFPQIQDDWSTDDTRPTPTPMEDTLEVVSINSLNTDDGSNLSKNPMDPDYAGCPPNTSSGLLNQNIDSTSGISNSFPDETVDSSQNVNIFRRQAVACPSEETLGNDRHNNITPFVRKAPSPSSSDEQEKVSENPRGACARTDMSVLVTCSGPEVLNPSTGVINIVANCIPGKFNYFFHQKSFLLKLVLIKA